MDALDWFRCRFYPGEYPAGAYPWEQFIRYAVHCTNIQGSALYDATLGDKQLIEELYAEAKKEQSAKKRAKPSGDELEPRPPRRGYSREVEAIYDLTDNIVALRAEMGRWSRGDTARGMSKRPWFPAEIVEDRMRRRSRKNRDRAIAESQAAWQEAYDNARIGT